ncbi:MAG: UDP-4-amino-4,6-dideoxy-N-acetyl-beta-L-altrosamine transaminase [Gammaproteobacteria bacterium]|nr:UDP-4-amino-4,6-dideoxy-N-acetyl-beta-L-altrosamine transaminase [Gammaproteobacteria bacterium]
MIPYGRQDIADSDIAAVCETLRSDFLTQGPQTPAFEREMAAYCGAAHACAANSATSALHLACLALELGPGDWLWTSPITFVASANCALHCGAQVDFVDIEPRTANLSADALEKKLAAAEKKNRLPKIVVPVHLAGQPCDLRAIHEMARHYGFRIIEDAAHAAGARYLGEPVGNCRYSDIAVFSFHPVKIITTGEGGIALTNDEHLDRRMKLLRSHGVTRDERDMETPPAGPWDYRQIALGYNYRMTDLQAALGRSQLKRLDSFVARRRQLARRYDERLAELPPAPLEQAPDGDSSFHLYIVRVAAEKHLQTFTALREAGIGVNLHYIPVHTQPYYRRLGFTAGDFPEAEAYYREAVSLPLYPALREAQQDAVIGKLREALAGARC